MRGKVYRKCNNNENIHNTALAYTIAIALVIVAFWLLLSSC